MRNVRLYIGLLLLLCGMIGCAATEPRRGGFGFFGDNGPRMGEPAKPTERARAFAHYIHAIKLEREGQFRDAVEEMRRVPELDPEAITPTLRLIRAYLYRQDFERALEMCERAVQQAPGRANLWIVLGEIYHQLERTEEAVAAFSKAIEMDPENILGYGALAEIEESNNDLIAAIEIYERLIELQPSSAGLFFQLGINLMRIGERESAVERFEQALLLNADLVRIRYLLGVLFLELNRPDEAIAHLVAYIEKRPNDLQATEALSGAFTRAGYYPEAFSILLRILQSDQVRPEHHIAVMYILLRGEKPDAAEKSIPAVGAPIFGQFMGAIARRDQGLPYMALVDGLDAIDGNLAEECNAYLNDLLYLFGKDEAGQWLLAALDDFEKGPPGARSKTLGVIRGRILMNQGRHAEAAEVLEAVIEAHGPEKDLHYYLAICYDEIGDFPATERHLKACLAYDPEDADILNFLGYVWAVEGVNLDEAEELLDRALAMDPENPYYLDSLGWIYYKQGKADEAIELIQQAIIKMDADDAILRDHLGDAYLLRGDSDRAIAEWERARRLDPELEGVQEKLDQHRPR